MLTSYLATTKIIRNKGETTLIRYKAIKTYSIKSSLSYNSSDLATKKNCLYWGT